MECLVLNQNFQFNDKVIVIGIEGEFKVLQVDEDEETVDLFGPFPGLLQPTCGTVSKEVVIRV